MSLWKDRKDSVWDKSRKGYRIVKVKTTLPVIKTINIEQVVEEKTREEPLDELEEKVVTQTTYVQRRQYYDSRKISNYLNTAISEFIRELNEYKSQLIKKYKLDIIPSSLHELDDYRKRVEKALEELQQYYNKQVEDFLSKLKDNIKQYAIKGTLSKMLDIGSTSKGLDPHKIMTLRTPFNMGTKVNALGKKALQKQLKDMSKTLNDVTNNREFLDQIKKQLETIFDNVKNSFIAIQISLDQKHLQKLVEEYKVKLDQMWKQYKESLEKERGKPLDPKEEEYLRQIFYEENMKNIAPLLSVVQGKVVIEITPENLQEAFSKLANLLAGVEAERRKIEDKLFGLKTELTYYERAKAVKPLLKHVSEKTERERLKEVAMLQGIGKAYVELLDYLKQSQEKTVEAIKKLVSPETQLLSTALFLTGMYHNNTGLVKASKVVFEEQLKYITDPAREQVLDALKKLESGNPLDQVEARFKLAFLTPYIGLRDVMNYPDLKLDEIARQQTDPTMKVLVRTIQGAYDVVSYALLSLIPGGQILATGLALGGIAELGYIVATKPEQLLKSIAEDPTTLIPLAVNIGIGVYYGWKTGKITGKKIKSGLKKIFSKHYYRQAQQLMRKISKYIRENPNEAITLAREIKKAYETALAYQLARTKKALLDISYLRNFLGDIYDLLASTDIGYRFLKTLHKVYDALLKLALIKDYLVKLGITLKEDPFKILNIIVDKIKKTLGKRIRFTMTYRALENMITDLERLYNATLSPVLKKVAKALKTRYENIMNTLMPKLVKLYLETGVFKDTFYFTIDKAINNISSKFRKLGFKVFTSAKKYAEVLNVKKRLSSLIEKIGKALKEEIDVGITKKIYVEKELIKTFYELVGYRYLGGIKRFLSKFKLKLKELDRSIRLRLGKKFDFMLLPREEASVKIKRYSPYLYIVEVTEDGNLVFLPLKQKAKAPTKGLFRAEATRFTKEHIVNSFYLDLVDDLDNLASYKLVGKMIREMKKEAKRISLVREELGELPDNIKYRLAEGLVSKESIKPPTPKKELVKTAILNKEKPQLRKITIREAKTLSYKGMETPKFFDIKYLDKPGTFEIEFSVNHKIRLNSKNLVGIRQGLEKFIDDILKDTYNGKISGFLFEDPKTNRYILSLTGKDKTYVMILGNTKNPIEKLMRILTLQDLGVEDYILFVIDNTKAPYVVNKMLNATIQFRDKLNYNIKMKGINISLTDKKVVNIYDIDIKKPFLKTPQGTYQMKTYAIMTPDELYDLLDEFIRYYKSKNDIPKVKIFEQIKKQVENDLSQYFYLTEEGDLATILKRDVSKLVDELAREIKNKDLKGLRELYEFLEKKKKGVSIEAKPSEIESGKGTTYSLKVETSKLYDVLGSIMKHKGIEHTVIIQSPIIANVKLGIKPVSQIMVNVKIPMFESSKPELKSGKEEKIDISSKETEGIKSSPLDTEEFKDYVINMILENVRDKVDQKSYEEISNKLREMARQVRKLSPEELEKLIENLNIDTEVKQAFREALKQVVSQLTSLYLITLETTTYKEKEFPPIVIGGFPLDITPYIPYIPLIFGDKKRELVYVLEKLVL